MSISSINRAGCSYAILDSSRKTAKTGNFADEIYKAAEENSRIEKSGTSAAGNMVIQQPPDNTGFSYDTGISTKSKEDMTMGEYRQWFMNEMSKMPVSGWYRSTCVGGTLTITEECFERMKNDPEWEKTVLGMVRKMYSCNGIMGSKMIGYQVIGATPEQCHGEGIPVTNSSPLSFGSKKSWWKKRQEKMQEQVKRQEEKAQKKALARRMREREIYMEGRRTSVAGEVITVTAEEILGAISADDSRG